MFTTTSTRKRLAGTIDKLRQDARTERPLLRGFRPLARPAVVAACEPTLARITALLESDRIALAPEALANLNRFLTEGATSPLYGHDALAANATARAIFDALDVRGAGVASGAAHERALVLLATDGSPSAQVATETAIALCKDTGQRLAVLSVHHRKAGEKGAGPAVQPIEDRAGAITLSESTAAEARERGVDAVAYVRGGSPAPEIALLADELGASMIVVGSRGFGALHSLIAGSVSRDLVRRAHVPVTASHA
jgi:nucleotide-binding universal stress UspA family protein